MKMGGANRDFFKLSPLGQVAWTVYALETAVYQLDPAEEGWREAEAKRSSFGRPFAHTGQKPRLRCLSLGSSGSFEKAPARPVFSGEAMFQGGTGAASSVCVNRAFDGPADKIFRKTSCTEMGFLV